MLLQRFYLFVCLFVIFVCVFFHYDSLLQTMLIEIHCPQFECSCILSTTYILQWVLFPGFLFLFFIFYAFSNPFLSLQPIFPYNRELDSGAFTECSDLLVGQNVKRSIFCGIFWIYISPIYHFLNLYITCTVIPVSKHVNPAWVVGYQVLPLDSDAILKVILEACNLSQERGKFGGNSVSLSCDFYSDESLI